jgi:uncharacterized protein YkwD
MVNQIAVMLIKRLVTGWLVCLLANMVVLSQTPSGKDLYAKYDYLNFRKELLFKEVIVFSNIDYYRINAVIFHLTNEIRIKNNLLPLSYSRELEKSATIHAQDMKAGNFFSHINETDAKKRTPNDRAKLCNIANPFLAENIIEGYGLQYKANETIYIRDRGQFSKTPEGELLKAHTYISFGEALITGWMNSKDHRKNILSKEALQLGCGATYFVNAEFNDMPSFLVVQNFQWYQPITLINP